ncbi:hypothetical protein F25303_10111 [Fusarium sp. NRRL 25303]|nr:hypothetical protein F25303_10111 [Fusarium sp. NRRL 25303]
MDPRINNSTTTQALDPPNDRWKRCFWDDPETIERYNALVGQWNAWAREDPAEKEENWIEVLDRLRVVPNRQATYFASVVTSKAQNKGGGRAAHWYPSSDIMGRPRYNEDGPSFPTASALDPTHSTLDRTPVRGIPRGSPEEDSGPQA